MYVHVFHYEKILVIKDYFSSVEDKQKLHASKLQKKNLKYNNLTPQN